MKTCADIRLQCHRQGNKELTGRNPDEHLVPLRGLKGADEEVFGLPAADFGRPGTVEGLLEVTHGGRRTDRIKLLTEVTA